MGFEKITTPAVYNMSKHLADSDPHPQYLLNVQSELNEVIQSYLEDHPIQVTGSLNDLTNVTITSPANGDALVYDSTTSKWINQATGTLGISDVQVNGTSVVSSGVANVPAATTSVYGAVRMATAAEVAAGSAADRAVSVANVSTMLSSYKSSSTGAVCIYFNDHDDSDLTWKIDDGVAHAAGEVVDGLSAGSHTITFQTSPDYTAPSSFSVNIIGGCLVSSYVEYKATSATLCVTLTPSTGSWSIDGGTTWKSSGTILTLDPGAYTVTFQSLANYNTPDPMSFALAAGQNMNVTQAYPSPSSKLLVTLNNAPAGARWMLDGGATEYESGVNLEGVSVGSHTITFKSISGYLTPRSQTITTVKDGQAYVATTYHASEYQIYGVRYLKGTAASSPDMTRLTVDLDTGTKHLLGDNDAWECLPAHNFKKCLVKNGAVNYYLDASDSTKKADGTTATLTGADGAVMVEIQPVYFRVDYVGVDSDNNEIWDWLISAHMFDGASIHPYFTVGRSNMADTRIFVQYLGAYESVLCTKSTGVGISTTGITSPLAYTSGTHSCSSVKGFKPVTNMTLAQFREAHVAAGLHSMNSLAMQFLALMMFIEYGSLDSQDNTDLKGDSNYDVKRGCAGNRSDGFVWYNAYFAYQYVRKSGRADYFGNGTGEVYWTDSLDYSGDSNSLPNNFASGRTANKNVVGFTYRGIENPFGHIFKFEDGILTDSTGYYWTPCPSLYTSDLTTAQSTYNTVTHTWPASGYIKFFTFTVDQPTFFVTETGGSSTTYLPDYFDQGYVDKAWHDSKPKGGCLENNPGRPGVVNMGYSWTVSLNVHVGSRSALSIID